MVFCLFTRNGTSKGQIVAKQGTFLVIACIVYAQHTVRTQDHRAKQEDHQVARTNKTPQRSSSSQKDGTSNR